MAEMGHEDLFPHPPAERPLSVEIERAASQLSEARGLGTEVRIDARVLSSQTNLLVQTVIVPGPQTREGTLIEAVAVPWFDIIALLQRDPTTVYQLSWDKWEEIIAGAYKRAGFDEVTLTPRNPAAEITGGMSLRLKGDCVLSV